jgi:hypothetical protein
MRAIEEKVTPNCRQSCYNCGAKIFGEGTCPTLTAGNAKEVTTDEGEN